MKKKDIYNAELAQGKTYQEIADMYGISRQAVYQSVNWKSGKGLRKRWPRLLLWIDQNNVSQKELAQMAGVSCPTLSDWLHGLHEPKKPNIDALLKVTGLTYEELFAE